MPDFSTKKPGLNQVVQLEWRPVSGGALSAQIVRQIREALLADKLSPGARLGNAATLAKQFKVSRVAVRDALNALSAAGIIDIKVGVSGGVFVAEPDTDRLTDSTVIQLKLLGISTRELFDAQMALEVAAAGIAAENASLEDLEKLEKLNLKMREHAGSPVEFTRAALDFHEQIVGASRNRVMLSQYRAMKQLLAPIVTSNTTLAVAERAIRSHSALLERLRAGDSKGARRRMHARLKKIRDFYLP